MIDGRIAAIGKGRFLNVFQRALWGYKVEQDSASEVVWELTKLGLLTTRLTLSHEGLEAQSSTCVQSKEGWPLILANLLTLLETGKPLEMSKA